jgi:beta-glucosidase-like glycosyl hydrolase
VEETFGEDGVLSAFMTWAWVTGAQGGVDGAGLARNGSIISEPKHFMAYSAPESEWRAACPRLSGVPTARA